ncbi:MAG TPA: NnrS family protein [Paracoccaceae bacterium]|nr:NnrS family protein [Paracoccaceae bacterium]
MNQMTGGIPRYRAWSGPAVLSAGFRPFFLIAGVWAAVAVPLWLCVLIGHLTIPSAFGPVAWHAHEMLFGFIQAAIAGFLLTAVPNWTGRMPIQGWSLGALAALLVAGRVAVAFSGVTGPGLAAIVDLAFPVALAAALGREIIAGRNWRNLPMLGILGVLGIANGMTHLEAMGWASTGVTGLRLGIAVVLLLIGLVGGRVIPSFTRNWLVKRGEKRLPAPAGRLDQAAMAATAAALVAWVCAPGWVGVAPLMALAAVATAVRLARWRGLLTGAEPLVWVLHLGFAWLPVGYALMALAPVMGFAETAALHALTGGAMTTMIVAVATRATRGHTGRALVADRPTVVLYGLVTLAAAARVVAGIAAGATMQLLTVAALAWTGAFVLFLVLYAPMLLRPRPGR